MVMSRSSFDTGQYRASRGRTIGHSESADRSFEGRRHAARTRCAKSWVHSWWALARSEEYPPENVEK